MYRNDFHYNFQYVIRPFRNSNYKTLDLNQFTQKRNRLCVKISSKFALNLSAISRNFTTIIKIVFLEIIPSRVGIKFKTKRN